jgi:hypothetical protein
MLAHPGADGIRSRRTRLSISHAFVSCLRTLLPDKSLPAAFTPRRLMPLHTTKKSKWEDAKPAVFALLVGLLAGPYLSNFLGWQVASGTVSARERASIVERLALICDAQARTEVQDPSRLGGSDRGDLAKKWAVMPGGAAADLDVVAACAAKLAGAGH